MRELTRKAFADLKADYDVYGTHTETDKYNNEQTVADDIAKCSINVMWQPLTDEASIAEYGKDVSRMFYCIVYDDPDIDYGDVIPIRGEDYEVVGMKYFNTYSRIEIRKKKV